MSAEHEPRRLPVVCRFLRTKMSFGSMVHAGPDWRTGQSTTAVYWCLRTMEPMGVDDNYVHPEVCQPGRQCCEVPIV